MRNFFAHLLSKTCRNQTNETESRQNRIEPLSKQLRAVYEPTTRDNALPAWSNFLRFAATKSFSRLAAMVTLLLTLACGNVWGDTSYSETHATPAATTGDFTQITATSGVSFGNSSLQISSNGGSGSFTVEVLDGSYIDSITFARNGNDYGVGSLEPHSGTSGIVTNRNSGAIWKFVPSANMSSATFDMSAPSGKKTRLNNIIVYWRSDYEHFTKNFSVSGSSNPYTVSSTKSNASSDVTITINSNSSVISSNGLSLGNGKVLTITSAGHNIKKIIFLAASHAAISNLSANAGTYTSGSKTWAAGSDAQAVTFTSSGSNAVINAISVELEEAGTYHSVTATTEDEDKGTSATASASVVEGGTTTITATPKSGYQFDHWTVSGTGASLSSTTTNPTTLTMGTADATVTAYFAEKVCPSSGTVYSLTVKSSTYSVPGTTETNMVSDYATVTDGGAYIGNNNGSAGKAQVTTTGSGTVFFNGADGYLKLVLDCPIKTGDELSFTNGSGSNQICFTTTNTRNTTYTTESNSYTFPAAFNDVSTIYVWRTSGSSTYLHDLTITRPAACTAPNHVDVAPTNADGWRYSLGETISLTATAYSSAGTESPITSGLTYQWQKYISSTWTDINTGTNPSAATATLQIANCSEQDGGAYRCKVSTGAGCETISNNGDGYFVRVFTLYGGYSGQSFGHHKITWTSTYRGTVTINLNASSSFKFKFTDNDGKWYGNGGTIAKDFATENDAEWGFGSNTDDDATLTTGGYGSGNYVFTVDITHYDDSPNKYVNLRSVVYPKKTTYLQLCSDWKAATAKYAIYYYNGGNNGWTDFMTAYACDGDILSADVPVWAANAFFVRFDPVKSSTGNFDNEWNRSGDNESTLPTDGKDYYHSLSRGDNGKYYGSWGTFSPSTYTITFANGGGTGSMSAIGSIACGANQALTANSFEKTGHTFNCWHADVDVTVGGATVTAGNAIANSATIQNITSNITLTAQWTPNNHDLTWNLDGGTTTSAGTGIASGVTATTTSSVAYGTTVTAPTVTKTGYNFSAWSPTVVSPMPDADKTYTAQWTAKTTTITIDANTANHGSTAPSPITATYGSALPSFTAAAGESGYSLTGYFTAATGGTKIINANGTLVASTDYADGSSKWKSEAASLTLYAQYEEEATEVTATWPMVSGSSLTLVGTADVAAVTPSNAVKGGSNIAALSDVVDASFTDYTGKMAKVEATGTIGESNAVTNDHYVKYTLTVASGYRFTPTGFSATVARYGTDNAYAQAVLKQGSTTIKSTDASKPNRSGKSTTKTVYSAEFNDASTYNAGTAIDLYIYLGGGMGSGKYYGIVSVSITGTYETASCSTPAAPTAFSAGSITSTGATFSITDEGNAASYDIYYSTSSDAPTAGTAATTTSDSKTKAVTGLTASTTYYAWVRSVCDASHKSAWVALSGSSFETSAAAACDEEPHNWTVVATSQKSYKVRISKVSGEVAIPVADATSKNITAYAGTVSTNDNVTVNIADGGSSNYGYKFDGSNTYLKLVFSSALVLNDTLVVEMTNASHNISFTTTATRATTYSTSAGKLIIPAALAGQTTLYLWRGSGNTMYLKRFKVLHTCDAADKCTVPVISGLSDQAVCPGSDLSTIWTASQTAVLAEGETVAYSWKKKGSETVLGTNATLDLGASAAESQAGTYVVTVTVSKAGKASSSASKEVTLTVTAAVEEPSITASKVKVYPGDAVTLTATCGTGGVTWQWYTCTNAAGDGESSIGGATSASYEIASAGSVGTYYYKVKATGSCASAAKVYTLNVLAADACDKEFWFAKEADRPTGAAAATHITGCPSGSSSASYTASIDGTNYTITGCTGQKTGNVTITVPADNTGTLYVVVQGSSSRTITLSKGGTQIDQQTPTNSVWGVYMVSDLDAGTYTLVSSGNISWGIIALKLCPTISCSDATPTATATNTTVCAGGTITITATGYEDDATFQWQKQNASTNAWENITDSTRATLCYASATSDHAGNYQVVATKTCARTSNTVTIAVPSVPVFGAVPASVSVMETQALSITTVEATDAVSYKWYKSANASLEAGDPEIGSSKELMKAYADEAIGTPSYYVFCVATNSCGADTTSAIAVNVTAYVEQDCAVVGSSGEHNTFGKTGNVSSGTYGGVTELHTNSNNKYIYYTAEDGYYFSKAIVNACVGNASDLPTASYSYSTDGGENWTDANLTGMTTDYQNHIINLPASVNAFRVGRRLGDTGTSSSTIYIHEVCFEYTERCTATTITVSSSSVEYEIGDPWSNPTFTVKHGGTAFDPQPTITYSSSNEDIATVDENTGEVSFNDRAGTVRITASYAGGEISSTEYCASQGSYTITVSCKDGAPRIFAASSVNLSGCNNSVDLEAKQSGGSVFADGTYQWYRNSVAISGATSASYTAVQAGTYTVERTGTGGCTNLSSNSAVITSEYVEPEVKHLVPCQYYHVDSTYSAFMKMRHLFTVSGSAEYNSSGRNFKMELSKNGAAATDVTTSNAFSVIKSDDNTIDTVMIDLNKLNGKYAENDELVLTCKAVDCSGNVSEVYKDSITIHVIDQTPTMALILAGKDGGALNEYEPKNLQKQTGEKTWSGEWPLYTELKKEYIITPLNGYAPFNKLNYEQYDIIFLTDFPKKSKNATAINNLADLVDYRPMFTFKTHMSGLSKWATKGFTEDPEVPKQSRLRLNIVCYAHPMFDELQTPSIKNQMLRDASDNTQLVYTLLTEGGYEKYKEKGKKDVPKGIQGFDFSASDNFVTIGLIHMDATAEDSVPTNTEVTWTPGSSDRTLVAAAERQHNPEARMVMFSLNAGAHSKLTETGQNVVLACLEYLLQDVMIKPMADCAYTFDNDEGRGNGKWSVATNWLQEELPGPYQAVKVIAPATVDYPNAKALEVRLIDDGKITIAKNGVLTVQSTIRRKDGSTAIPTEDGDLVIETAADGQGALIFNNDRGDSRATVNLYSLGRKDGDNYQFQYIAMPMGCVPVHPYFEGSDILTYAYTEAGGWERRGYYTDLYAFEGIGITTRRSTASSFVIQGALTSTESQSLDMTYENSIAADKGYNMFGNSWSAPIQISQLGVGNGGADIQKTVYIYVAGKDPDGGPTSSGDKTEVAGKWLAIPFDASGFAGWTGLKVIPAFQAFEIQANSATTFKLDYNKMVRGGTTDMNEYLRAPKRRTAEHEGIELMVLHLAGGKVNNDLFMFEGEQFSDEFDNGWEATFKEDEEIPTQLYSPTTAGKMAVAALPTLEGAKVNFTTNEAGEYMFTFSGAESGYYLNDLKEQKSALVKEGNAYVFTLEDGEAADRFYISRTPLGAPAIATGVDEIDAEAMKVRKIIHNDQLYIIRGGQLYDATGKAVK